jgi:2-dehydro-3-deoxygluconokinase
MSEAPAPLIAAFGEIMLRLSPPGRERLFQSPRLRVFFGGGEANVLVSLSAFGRRTRFISVVPPNPAGDSAVAELRRRGVGTEWVLRGGRRLGVYFAETGSSQRPSRVVYDREGSALSDARPGDIDWKSALAGAGWLHVTGITPALGAAAAELTREALKEAEAGGIKVSLDLNHRSKLWNGGRSAPEVMNGLASWADVLLANEEDIQKSLGLDADSVDTLTASVMDRFPRLEAAAVTLRRSLGADRNGWSAALRTRRGFWTSRDYDIMPIVDRIGAGDAFAAGIIHGWSGRWEPRRTLEFAAAASCLKHTVPGDFNLVTEAEVEDLVAGDATGRIKR